MAQTGSFRRYGLIAAALAVLGAGCWVGAQGGRVLVGKQPDGSYVVSTGSQSVTPAGKVHLLEGVRPKDLAVSPDGRTVAALTTGKVVFFKDGEPAGQVPLTAGALGIAWAPDGGRVYASTGAGKVARLALEEGKWRLDGEFGVEDENLPLVGVPMDAQPAQGRRGDNAQANGLAVSLDGSRLFVALGTRNTVSVVELPAMKPVARVAVGVAPYSVLLSRDGKTLFVANRGGARVPAGEDTEPSAGTPVRVDPATDAPAQGTVSLVDIASFTVFPVQVGRQPAGMAVSPDGDTLYVANSDDDTVSFVDVKARRATRTLSVTPPADPGFGQIPTGCALSGDGRRLFVSLGGANAVAVLDLKERGKVEGYVPTGWYPAALAEGEGTLTVACAKGIGSRLARQPGRFGVHSSVGLVQVVSPADFQDLKKTTAQVAKNNRWGTEPAPRRNVAAVPVPERVGEPSVFKHVVYIIRENHTYDQDLGDMPEGNGDPKLVSFGEDVTPNSHALAREFVLLDNTYTSGTNSADGHQWTSSGVANGYIEQNYSAHIRSYPYDGGDPLAYSPAGFLWTAAARKGLTQRVYGEFVNRPKITPVGGKIQSWKNLWDDYRAGGGAFQITAETDQKALRPFLHPNYIGFPLVVSDQWRADLFLADLKEAERTGNFPALNILLLPNDHTSGTRPGMPTPRAQTADNDLALGRIVEAISRSRFWKDTLVLVIEDDSQSGVDHVDGHRTVAFCVSPYTRRGAVVSENYNHTSFVRTMGLVLGFPALNRFDRSATPLTACFTPTPDTRPFTHRPNKIPLDEMNPPARALRGAARRLAEACERLDWSDVDRADAETVSRAIWMSQHPNRPFPAYAYHPVEDEDDEVEAEERD